MGDYKRLVLNADPQAGVYDGRGLPAEDQWFYDLVELRHGKKLTDAEYRAAYAAGEKATAGIADVGDANRAAGAAIAKLLPPTLWPLGGARGAKHYGPGAHESGSDQDAHGGGGSEPRRVVLAEAAQAIGPHVNRGEPRLGGSLPRAGKPAKRDATRAEIGQALGTASFKLRHVSFSDLARAGAYQLSVDGFELGGIMSAEDHAKRKPLIAKMNEVCEKFTYKGEKII